MVPDQISREIHVEAPVTRVWDVLTKAEHVAEWFGDAARVDLREGGELVLGWTAHGSFHAEITRVDPPTRFSYRWHKDAEVTTPPIEADSTLVEFTLTPDGDGTLLRVVESGFAGLAVPAEEQAHVAAENTKGWGEELGQLKVYAEK
ncbi:hypothetical protein Afil01_56410 [Actinorhabdospora filicis]|uniref:Activator of Hsp90 ATPase homologue 1/2-like C-terminal domain-containing protein n=1 Tax=Actinorhabdospora filicis TaxID=1785913 RepID=A0A9W6SPZ9_9ACTN|nr:SRPBCC family protein [Actinorhabdospora filicis]GLZ80834.1 hypothetical protein Afil01_56410 [Actinorhabdospora filicis]